MKKTIRMKRFRRKLEVLLVDKIREQIDGDGLNMFRGHQWGQ